MNEPALVKKLNRRSRPALEAAVRQFTPYVSTVILNELSGRACREDVEEMVSDVFLALWRSTGELDPARGLRPWLAAVARNRAIDWLRKSRPSKPIPDDAADPAANPEEQAERREWSAKLWSAVDALPEPDRSLFLGYYYEGEKLKNVAKALGPTQSSAKKRLFRGRKRLKVILTEEGVERI